MRVIVPGDSRPLMRRFFDLLIGRHHHIGANRARYNYGYGYVMHVTYADYGWKQCAICSATWDMEYRPQVVIVKQSSNS